MIKIGRTLVSEELRTREFVCQLSACKGECCVQGDAGAPLEPEERQKLEEVYPVVAPYLRPEGQDAILEEGIWVEEGPDDYVTPLVNGQECAYVIFEEGIALCAIEKAYREGKIDWPKPISCHLYPIRITRLRNTGLDALNYERWSICNAACQHGEALGVPVYRFLKEPLTRKYGEAYYEEMVAIFEAMEANEQA